MDLKRLITQFAYRIEPQPEGGFIAHTTDPSIPPLEAPTRQELQKKIQERIFAAISSEFPALKLPTGGSQRHFAFHIERTPEGSFSIHSADPNADVIHASTDDELQNHFLQKLVGFAGKHFMPELQQALAAQGTADVKIVLNGKTAITLGSNQANLAGLPQDPQLATQSSAPPTAATLTDAGISRTIDNSPITPERSNFGTILKLALALLVIASLLYIFVHHP
jgi:hypothetical protein